MTLSELASTVIKDTQGTWNNTPTFVKPQVHVGMNQKHYAIPLPRFMYVNGGTHFKNYDARHEFGMHYTLLLEYTLFALNTIHTRLQSNGIHMEKYPINLYIEDLRTNGGEFVEHRLHIVEDLVLKSPIEVAPAKDEDDEEEEEEEEEPPKKGKKAKKPKKDPKEKPPLETEFALVFRECALSVKKTLNIFGQFEDIEGSGNNARDNQKKKKLHAFELYKLVSSPELLNNLLMIVTRRVTPTDTNLKHISDIGKMLSLPLALALTDENVSREQRHLEYYIAGVPKDVQTVIHGQPGLYKVAPYYWHVPFFMEQYFPHVQLDNRYIAWNNHLSQLAAAVDKKNADLKKHNEEIKLQQDRERELRRYHAEKQRRMDAKLKKTGGAPQNGKARKTGAKPRVEKKSNSLLDAMNMMEIGEKEENHGGKSDGGLKRTDWGKDSDDDDEDYDMPPPPPPPRQETEEERAAKMQIIEANLKKFVDPTNDPVINIGESGYKVGAVPSEDALINSGLVLIDVTEDEFEIVSYETHKESFKSFGLRQREEDVSEYDLEKSHILYSMKRQHQAHAMIIYEAFKDDAEKYDRYMCSLDDVMIERYTRMCMSPASNISENATKYMQYWQDREMDKIDLEVVISDSSLSVMDNFVAWQVAGTKQYLGVAFHTLLVHIVYVSAGDMFRLEWGDDALHQAILLTGDGGGGKSVASNAAQKLIYKDVCERVTDTSRQQEGRSLNSIDNFQYGDDVDLTKFVVSKDGFGALKKELMTSGSVKRKVLAMDKDDSSNRYVDEFIYVWCGVTLECSNKGAMEISAAAQRSGGSSVDADALMSRYILFDVPMVTDPVNTLDAAISAAEKTADEKNAEQLFIDKNIKIHIIRMHYWHLVYIGALRKPNMMLFDTVFPKLLPRVKKLCPGASTNRSTPKIRTWTMQRVVLRSILDLMGSPISPYTKEPVFEPRFLKQLVTTVIVDDIIASFTGFFRTFYPSDMNVVIDILKKMMTDAIKNNDGSVAYQNPNSTEDFAKMQKQFINLKDDIYGRLREDDHRNRESNMMKSAERSGLLEHSINRFNNENGDDDNGSELGEGRRSRNVEEEDHHNNNNNNNRKPDQDIQDEEKNVSYVCFRDKNLKTLAEHVSVMADGRSVKPSLPSINRCLQMIARWKIETPHYKWKKGYTEPLVDEEGGCFDKCGIVTQGHNVFINYKVFANEEYTDLCTSIISEVLNYEHAVPGKYLSLIPNPEAYDLPSYVRIEADKSKQMIVDNHKYIPEYMHITLQGVSNREKMADVNRSRTMYIDSDMDSVSLINFYNKQTVMRQITFDMIKHQHPVVTKNMILTMLERNAEDGIGDEDRELQMYPEQAIIERMYMKQLKLNNVVPDMKNKDDCQKICSIINTGRVDVSKVDIPKNIRFYQSLGTKLYNARSLKAIAHDRKQKLLGPAPPPVLGSGNVAAPVNAVVPKPAAKKKIFKFDETTNEIVLVNPDGSAYVQPPPQQLSTLIMPESNGQEMNSLKRKSLYLKDDVNVRITQLEKRQMYLNNSNDKSSKHGMAKLPLSRIPSHTMDIEAEEMYKDVLKNQKALMEECEKAMTSDVLEPPRKKPMHDKEESDDVNGVNDVIGDDDENEVSKKSNKKITIDDDDDDEIELTDDDDDDDYGGNAPSHLGVYDKTHS